VVLEDLRRLRAAGIHNLNVDLIAGLAGQTFASWEESLAVLAGSGVPHASVYMLEVDQDSRLGREVLARGVRYQAGLVPTDDAIVQMYSLAIERLKQSGLEQYEISELLPAGDGVAPQSALLAAAALSGNRAGRLVHAAGGRLFWIMPCAALDHKR